MKPGRGCCNCIFWQVRTSSVQPMGARRAAPSLRLRLGPARYQRSLHSRGSTTSPPRLSLPACSSGINCWEAAREPRRDCSAATEMGTPAKPKPSSRVLASPIRERPAPRARILDSNNPPSVGAGVRSPSKRFLTLPALCQHHAHCSFAFKEKHTKENSAWLGHAFPP